MSAALMLGIFSRLENWKRDLTTNHAKLDPRSSDHALRPLTIGRSPEEVAALIERWAAAQPHWTFESSETTDSEITIHLTRSTKLLRFIDDIQIRLTSQVGGTQIEAESQSRLGKADFGQNPKNLKELVSGLREDR